MKKATKTIYLAIAIIVAMSSCQKIDDLKKAEGLKSTTGSQEYNVEDEEGIVESEVVFHKHYDGNLTKEEVNALWEEDVKGLTFAPLKGYSTEWFHKVQIRTGTQTNNETDGAVACKIVYRTSHHSNAYTSYRNLDNPGDDREGGWDIYILRSTISGSAIQWIELKSASLRLKGTDGWFVTDFDVLEKPQHQTVPATGLSTIWSAPNQWLDSNTSSQYDYYHTGTIGTGRLTF